MWRTLDLLLGGLKLFIVLVLIRLSVAKVVELASNIETEAITLDMSCRIV